MKAANVVLLAAVLCAGSAAQNAGNLPPHVRLIKPLMPGVQATRKPVAPAPSTQVAQGPVRCAHILVYTPPPDLDAKFVIEAPKVPKDSMPVYKALPPCPEDIRLLRR
jgi:hypothetical protein